MEKKKTATKKVQEPTRNSKKSIIVGIAVLFVVMLILLGLTYAYYRTRVIGNDKNTLSVVSKLLEIKYEDGSATMNMDGLIEPDFTYEKTFSVRNTGDESVTYGLYLEEVINTFVNQETDPVSFDLTCESTKGTCESGDITVYPEENTKIVSNTIESGAVQTYTLKVNYPETNKDQSDNMGKQLAGKVQIYDESIAVDIEGSINGANAGDYVEINSKPKRSQIRNGRYKLTAVEIGEHTLYIKDKNGNVRGSAKLTINKGSQGVSGTTITIDEKSQTATLNITSISTNLGIEITKVSEEKAPFVNPYTEGTLAYEILNDNNDLPSAEDDYTTTTGNLSYYYRGAVENNYVNYSGMCWRIVRIEGDGSVKLILEDKSSNCNDATKYTGNWEVAESGYGFQEWRNQWSEAGSIIDYKDEFALRNNLINWLENSVINQNQLKTDEWCLGNLTDVYNYYNDHSLLTDENTTIKDLKYDGNIKYYFETGKRLDGIEGNPVMTFNCKSIGYEYDSLKVGTLTADEAMFAGASRNQNTSNLYLINNYQKNNNKDFWTLTPHSGDTNADRVYYLSSSKMKDALTTYTTDDWNEDLDSIMLVASSSVRPAITLLKETPLSTNTTSTQVGTQTNPYVID